MTTKARAVIAHSFARQRANVAEVVVIHGEDVIEAAQVGGNQLAGCCRNH